MTEQTPEEEVEERPGITEAQVVRWAVMVGFGLAVVLMGATLWTYWHPIAGSVSVVAVLGVVLAWLREDAKADRIAEQNELINAARAASNPRAEARAEGDAGIRSYRPPGS